MMKTSDGIAEIMNRFPREKQQGENFAAAYIEFMTQYGHQIVSQLTRVPRHDRNLTLISDATSLRFVGRRLALLSDLFVFGETSMVRHEYIRHDPADDPEMQKYMWGTAGLDSGDWEPSYYVDTHYIYTSDWHGLRSWIESMKKFVLAGKAVYIPRIESETEHIARYRDPSEVKLIDPIFDKANYLIHEEPALLMESPQLAPLFSLEIPHIDSISEHTLFDILEAESDTLGRFRDTLLEAFREAEKAWGSDHYASEVGKIQRTIINEGVRQIKSDMRTLRAKTAVQAAGAVIGYATLSISVVLGIDPIVQILGPAGVSVYAAKQIADYLDEVKKIREKPLYFLWELGTRTHQP